MAKIKWTGCIATFPLVVHTGQIQHSAAKWLGGILVKTLDAKVMTLTECQTCVRWLLPASVTVVR